MSSNRTNIRYLLRAKSHEMCVDSQQTRATTHIMSRYLTTINDLMYVIMKQKQLVLEKVQDFFHRHHKTLPLFYRNVRNFGSCTAFLQTWLFIQDNVSKSLKSRGLENLTSSWYSRRASLLVQSFLTISATCLRKSERCSYEVSSIPYSPIHPTDADGDMIGRIALAIIRRPLSPANVTMG